jgi:hypothetical protein
MKMPEGTSVINVWPVNMGVLENSFKREELPYN